MPALTAKPVRHPTLVDQLIDHVYDRIASGELKPAQRITEDQLAADFGVSRTPVREAVRRMAEIGLLVVHPRCRLEIASVNQRDLQDVTQLRATLECMAIRLAMGRMTEQDIRDLERIQGLCEKLMKEGDRLRIFRQDGQFHLAIAAQSGNRHLAETLGRLEVQVQLCRMLLCRSDKKIQASVRFHRRILAAIRAGDVDGAERLLRKHVDGTLEE